MRGRVGKIIAGLALVAAIAEAQVGSPIRRGTRNPFDTATSTTVNVYNVLDYGATGNGATDNRAAFVAARNAACASPYGAVYVPRGTYVFSTHSAGVILAPCSNLMIFGDGEASVLKMGNFGTADIEFIKGPASNITIRDLRFDMNAAQNPSPITPTVALKNAIRITSGSHVFIRDITIFNQGGQRCITIGGGGTLVTNAQITGLNVYNVSDGVDLDNDNVQDNDNPNAYDHSSIYAELNGGVIANCTLRNPYESITATAIELHGKNVAVSANSIENYNVGVLLAGIYTDLRSITVTGNAMFGVRQALIPFSTFIAGTGTISVTNGNAAVTGTSTTFRSSLRPGSQIKIGATTGVVLTIASDTALTLLTTWGGATAGPVAYTHNPILDAITFSNNTVVTSSAAKPIIDLRLAMTSTGHSIDIVNNHLTYSGNPSATINAPGIDLGNWYQIRIRGNTIRETDSQGIRMTTAPIAGLVGVEIVGNTFVDCARTTLVGASYGMYFSFVGTLRDLRIIDNDISNSFALSNPTALGIEVQGVTATRASLRDNRCVGIVTCSRINAATISVSTERITPYIEGPYACTVNTAVNATTATAVTGATTGAITPGNEAFYQITAAFDVTNTTFVAGKTFIGELTVNGAAEAATVTFEGSSNGARATVTGVWLIPVTGGTAYTFALTGKVSDATGGPAYQVNATHTRFSIVAVARY